jgi:excisionase family DNA binding protein
MHCGRDVRPIHFYKASGRPRCLNNRTWTPARKFALISLWEQGYSDAQIADKLGVSVEAVHIKRVRWHVGTKAMNRDVFTAREVARMFGIGCSKAVASWIDLGLLRGRRGPVRCGGVRKWQITREALERFIRDERTWPNWNPDRLTDPLLKALADEVRGDVRFLTLGEAAERFHVEAATIGQWIDKGWLQGYRPGRRGNHLVKASDVERLAPTYVWGEGLKAA